MPNEFLELAERSGLPDDVAVRSEVRTVEDVGFQRDHLAEAQFGVGRGGNYLESEGVAGLVR